MTRLAALVHWMVGIGATAWFGCGGAHSGAELRFWAMGREGEVVSSLMPEFERRHPSWHVRVQQVPWSAAHEKLLTAFVGDVMPDVYQLGSTWVAELAAIGAALPLDGFARRQSPAEAADYFAGVLDANRVDGVAYGVPWYVDTRVLFYRSDLLETAGASVPLADWGAWVEAMRGVQPRLAPDGHALLLPVREWQPLVIFALQQGATLLRDGNRYGNFQSPQFRAAFAFYLDLFRRGLAPVRGDQQVANVYQDFAAGFFAFYITGPWNLGEFATRLPPAMADRWATTPIPGPTAEMPGVSIAGGASLAISPRARDRDAAWELVRYLSEPATQVEFYRLTGDLPARRAAWSDGALAGDPHVQAFWTQLQHLRAPPTIPEWERIANRITDYADAAIRGELTADDALFALDRDVDAILAKRRWMLERRRGAARAG
jgi:multiple sugar transport system substrate-binding protein